MDQAKTHDHIAQLAITLFAAQTLDDLLRVAPAAVAAALGVEEPCDILLHDADSQAGSARAASSANERASIPLRVGAREIGRLVIGSPGDEDAALARHGERALSVAAVLASAISDRRAALATQEKLQSDAAQLKFDIIAMLSHELRTPLAAIKGFASTLLLDRTDWSDEQRVELVTVIEEECDRMTRLVSDILDSAVIEAGELRLDLEPILIRHVARRVVDTMSLRSRAHHIVLSIPETFPIVLADAQRVEQILTNLLDNAIKYSPDGGLIVVRGEVADHAPEVIISVADEGVGIAPEHLNKLFERFFRAQSDDRPRVRGTGLGLPLCDAIVRAHGGRIWAESTLGAGTMLSFTLPIYRAPDDDAAGALDE
jgi:signal transduction histidine kinase